MPEGTTTRPAGRLASLDALRGFDMLWIMGADRVIWALAPHSSNPVVQFLNTQFTHVEWEGFRFYDLIFPLFLFMIGCSIPFSFGKRLARGDSKGQLYRHVLIRVAIMIFFGMMINGNLLTYDPSKFQITYSVLQVLALGYLVAALIYLNMRLRAQILTTAAMLVLFWALMTFVPVPGHTVGVYQPGANFGDWLNDLILGDWQKRWRFGWILQIMTNGGTAMLGVFAGALLRGGKSAGEKLRWLVWLGLGCAAAGWVWGLQFPIIKNRWTSTYVLYAGGWSYLLLALFYWLIDVKGWRKWAFPFTVIGMNAIFTYMVWGLLSPGFRRAAEVFTRGLEQYVGVWHDAIAWAFAAFLMWLVLYFLYRQRTFVRI